MKYKKIINDVVKLEDEIEDKKLESHLIKHAQRKCKNDLFRNVLPIGQNSKPKDSKLMKESRSKNNLMQNTRGMK